MPLIEEIARFLKSNFQDIGVTYGFMPQEPARCIVVHATDVRLDGSSRVQIMIRGADQRSEIPARDADTVLRLMDGFCGYFIEGGHFVTRCEITSGAAQLGTDQNNRQLYSINVRVWHCEK